MDAVKYALAKFVKDAIKSPLPALNFTDCVVEVVSLKPLETSFRIKANAGKYPGEWRYFSVKVTEHI